MWVLCYSQPYGGRNLFFISLSLDWSDHCPPFTTMTDQQTRKQGWIIVPTDSPPFLKWSQKYNSMVYFGLQCISCMMDVHGSAESQNPQKLYQFRKAEFLTEFPGMTRSEKHSHSTIILILQEYYIHNQNSSSSEIFFFSCWVLVFCFLLNLFWTALPTQLHGYCSLSQQYPQKSSQYFTVV